MDRGSGLTERIKKGSLLQDVSTISGFRFFIFLCFLIGLSCAPKKKFPIEDGEHLLERIFEENTLGEPEKIKGEGKIKVTGEFLFDGYFTFSYTMGSTPRVHLYSPLGIIKKDIYLNQERIEEFLILLYAPRLLNKKFKVKSAFQNEFFEFTLSNGTTISYDRGNLKLRKFLSEDFLIELKNYDGNPPFPMEVRIITEGISLHLNYSDVRILLLPL